MSGARVGGPIALIILGLILALAISDRISGIDLGLIGWILAGAGVLWLIIALVTGRPRSAVTRETTTPGAVPGQVDREVRHDQL